MCEGQCNNLVVQRCKRCTQLHREKQQLESEIAKLKRQLNKTT